jgi:hypothetical protein
VSYIELPSTADQRWPSSSFTRKFWEFYLSSIMRGKELHFEFEVVKDCRQGMPPPLLIDLRRAAAVVSLDKPDMFIRIRKNHEFFQTGRTGQFRS